MPKTIKQQLVARLEECGLSLVKRMARFDVYSLPGTTANVYLGKNGAFRRGRTVARSLDISNYRDRFLRGTLTVKKEGDSLVFKTV